MLLGCAFREWLEPVGDVGHTVLHGPGLHAFGHLVSDSTIEWMTIVDTVDQCLIGFCTQVLTGLFAVEYQFAEILRSPFGRTLCRYRLLLESILYHVKSKLTHNLKI